MLNGLDPIIIFTLYKKVSATGSEKIPLVAEIINKFALPPIPIYLSERLTGIGIDSEDKTIDIETKTDTLSSSDEVSVNQKAIGSTISINMFALKDSIGLTLLSAIADSILAKVTSKEYSVTYLHGAITIFDGLLHGLSINQEADTDRYSIRLEIARGETKKASIPQPANDTGAASLSGGGKLVGGSLPSTSSAAGATFTTPPSGGTAIGGIP